jgi:protein required for attachment to host cells
MVQIVSAYFGDENSFRNITQSLISKISGGALDVVADEKLLPAFEAAPKTNLTPVDQKNVRDEAVKACGGEADQKCLEATSLQLRQDKLKQKELQEVTKNVIKGRRLTVNILENGKVKQLVAPDGQKLELKDVEGGVTKEDKLALPTPDVMQKRAWEIAGVIFAAFLYVFGIAAVYAIFMRQYEITGKASFQMVAYGATVVAIVLPYSGYFIILGYFGFQAFIAEYVAKA